MMLRSVRLAFLWTTLVSPAGSVAAAGGTDGDKAPAWAFEVTAIAYFLPDEADYVQPKLTADRGSFHLESRYAYEDRKTFSLFAGWTATTGQGPKLEVTPMAGVVVGRTDGIAPGLELTLSWGPVELYSESEYVIAFADPESSFFYAWSELGVRPTGWLRVGLVAQRTRRFHTPREVSFGPMLGVAIGKLEATAYVLDGGSARPFAALAVVLSL
jgi:hypothetical protein